MRKPIYIFTLAEKKAFKFILCNFLGWAPRSTYAPPQLGASFSSWRDEIINLLKKVRDEEGEIHVSHLFCPFTFSGFTQYDNKFFLDCIDLLKILLDTKLLPDYPIVFDLDEFDQSDGDELSFLRSYSPPLYNKLIAHMKKSRHESEVEVTCYGKITKYPSRDYAIRFFEDCQLNSEGAERDRYTDILIQLRSGAKKVQG